MRRHKIITRPVNLNGLGFEELFEEAYNKIQHDWQKTPVRPHLRGWRSHAHKVRHA
jgi:hypothetical protein